MLSHNIKLRQASKTSVSKLDLILPMSSRAVGAKTVSMVHKILSAIM